MLGWQWHQLDRMQITYTSLQTDNHAMAAPHQSIFRSWLGDGLYIVFQKN